MHSNWWLDVLSYLEIAGMAGVLLALLWKRIAGNWPSLFLTILLEICTNLSLLYMISHHTPYRVYFYTYWVSLGVRSLLKLWIIGDIMRSFKGLDFLPWQFYNVVGIIGATIATASAAYCWRDGKNLVTNWRDFAFLVDRSVAIAWITFALVLLLTAKIFNFLWDEIGARICNGVAMGMISRMIVSSMMSSSNKTVRLWANGIDSVFSIAIFVTWVYFISMWSGEDPPPISDGSTEPKMLIDQLLDMGSSRER